MDAKMKALEVSMELGRMVMFVDKLIASAPPSEDGQTLVVELPMHMVKQFGKLGTMAVCAMIANNIFTMDELDAAMKVALVAELNKADDEADNCPCETCTDRRAMGIPKPSVEVGAKGTDSPSSDISDILSALRARAQQGKLHIVPMGELHLEEGQNPIDAIAQMLGMRSDGNDATMSPTSTRYKH